MQKPVIFLAFANSQTDELTNLVKEENAIMDTLLPLQEQGLIEVYNRGKTNIENLFKAFSQYRDRVVIFHYGGHADGENLYFGTEDAASQGLAKLLAEQKNLELVFLNGCSTKQQVEDLLNLGIKHVIATSSPIDDDKASSFALQFYQALANKASIDSAFKEAIAKLETQKLIEPNTIQSHRYPKALLKEKVVEKPWGLFSQEEVEADWGIQELEKGNTANRNFNEILTEKLIEAIQPYSKDATSIVSYMQKQNISNWASQEKYATKAKEILTISFVGVIGMQISHLMGIGKDNRVSAEDKIIPYIEKCLLIARYSLDLVTFAFVSKLWDMQQKTPLSLNQEQREVLVKFFERRFEAEFLEQLTFLKALYPLFASDDLPFSEMTAFHRHFEKGSALYQSCEKLQALKSIPSEKYGFQECDEAERELSQVMAHFNFLAHYNMASIKRVGFKHLRNTDPHFIHNYIELGFDQKANPDVEKYNYTPKDIATDTVLIYQGENYRNSINLFPFVLDYNALTFEQGPKIYFYQCLNFQHENTLEYALLKDDEVKKIEFEDIQKQHADFNDLIADNEKMKVLNLDHALLQFREAKAKLTSQQAAKDDEFEALFN